MDSLTMHRIFPPDDERGASGVEYGLLIAGIFLTITAAVWGFGSAFSNLNDESCDGIVGAIEKRDACR